MDKKTFSKLLKLEEANGMCGWAKDAYEGFACRMQDDSFPCPFSKKAWTDSSLFFLFCECMPSDGQMKKYQDFFSGLTNYTQFVIKTEARLRLFSPLVVFFSKSFCDDHNQLQCGWEILNAVNKMDIQDWPQEIPLDPENPK